MHAHPFYLLTCALAVAAIALDCAAKLDAGRAMRLAGRGASGHAPQQREALLADAHVYVSRSDYLSVASAIVLVSALGAWGCSLWRRERGLQRLPLVLFVLAVFFQFLMV